jgi:hypothetical protein
MRCSIGDNIECIIIEIGIIPNNSWLTVSLKGGETITTVRWM